jgi:hypothetical protein
MDSMLGRLWRGAWRSGAHLVAGCALLALAACGGGGGGDNPPPPPPPATATVSGVVASSATGAALAGVSVAAGGKSTTTAADGSYTLADVPVGSGTVPVSFSLAGYAPGTATVTLAFGLTARASPRLVPVGASQTFAAAAGATVSVPNSPAQVSLPAGGFVNAAGAAFSGNVTARVTPIDPAADPDSMPGDFRATAPGGGAPRAIESFGALNVTLTDDAGNRLNLATGRTATIRIPVATRSADVPPTIPLFWFNEQTGLWVEEGTATLAGTAPNRYYEGTVAHFTTWNADRLLETIFVRGCLQDAAGARVANAGVQSVGVDYSGRGSATTNANGEFAVPMRRGGVASIYAEIGNRQSNVVRAGPSQTDITLPSCLVLAAGPAAPVIVEQPTAVTARVDEVAVFSVQAIGTPPLRYQWRKDGTPIANATSAYLAIFPVGTADAGSYTVVVSNVAGSATSDAATLTVDTSVQPPLITNQPAAATVAAGQTARFSVSAQSRGGTLTYQWRRDGAPISGATGTEYTTPPTVAGDDGAVFSVVVSSSNGTQTVSDGATLRVQVPVAPAITAQPTSARVNVGQQATFSVTATGTPAPTFQWRRNGAAITGATASSYTTPATVAGDNGARFSVVVTNSQGSVTSNDAVLTVDQPAPTGGYHLVAQAGPSTTAAIVFANGSQSLDLPALVAVSVDNPAAGAITIEPAGVAAPILAPVFGGTISNGSVSNVRSLYTGYVKGTRFYKVDQTTSGGAAPTGALWSTLTTGQVCGDATGADVTIGLVEGSDLADPTRSWTFLRAPGADGTCGTADDTTRGLRIAMGASDAAATVNGQVMAEIGSTTGSAQGFVVRQGTAVSRVDANLNPVGALFTVSAGEITNYGVSYGASLPGVWLFLDGNTLYGVNLERPTTRVALATLAAGEDPGTITIASDGATAYVGINSQTGSRVLRLTDAPAATALTTFAGPLQSLRVTPTRLVAQLPNSQIVSVLKSNGSSPVTLQAALAGFTEQYALTFTAGENVYILGSQFGSTPSPSTGSSQVIIVNADGTNRAVLANTSLAGVVSAATTPLAPFDFEPYAITVASPMRSVIDASGATLRAIEAATRNPLVTYGTLPATPAGIVFQRGIDPAQYGGPGLFGFTSLGTAGTTEPTVDLFLFDSDNTGLPRITNFVTSGGAAAPNGGQRVQAPQRAATPVSRAPGQRR